MSELINNQRKRIDKLKELILSLHKGAEVPETQQKLKKMLGEIPHGEIIQAEQELIDEGLSKEEVLKFCDVHSQAMRESIQSQMTEEIPEGHPVDTMFKENRELEKEFKILRDQFKRIGESDNDKDEQLFELRKELNNLMDIEKHYLRKEHLIFPILEEYGITGPSTVMWGKHDQIRDLLKTGIDKLKDIVSGDIEAIGKVIDDYLEPGIAQAEEMIYKEENILLPMCVERFTTMQWYKVHKESPDIGYCLYFPETTWIPDLDIDEKLPAETEDDIVRISTGTISAEELEAMMGSIPIDFTFVDKEDKVKFVTHGSDQIFQRPKSVIGRKVQYCHPPKSVHIVDKIVEDFKSGKQDRAVFWIDFKGKYVWIAYYAVRDKQGNYLGTVELTQDIKEFRKLEGERRILNYD